MPSSCRAALLPLFAPLIIAYAVVSVVIVTAMYVVTRPCPRGPLRKSFTRLGTPFFRLLFLGPLGPGALRRYRLLAAAAATLHIVRRWCVGSAAVTRLER